MSEAKMPEGEVAIWGAPDTDERDQIVRRLFTADQMRAFALQARREALEEAAKACERLRDDHCAQTQMIGDYDVSCLPDSPICDFVTAWNDAAAAIRELSKEKE